MGRRVCWRGGGVLEGRGFAGREEGVLMGRRMLEGKGECTGGEGGVLEGRG